MKELGFNPFSGTSWTEKIQVTIKTCNVSQSLHGEDITAVTLHQGVPIYLLNAEICVCVHLLEKPALKWPQTSEYIWDASCNIYYCFLL